ncbi:hypothetical protein BH23CHL2_BH23CHL2_36580 [soil metagenome]
MLTTRSGSLMLTPERVLFLSPIHAVLKWRNCQLSLPLAEIVDLRWRRLRPAFLFIFPEQIRIDLKSRKCFYFSITDAIEWCGASQHRCEIAGHSFTN